MQLAYISAGGEQFRLHGAKLADGVTLVKDTLTGFVAEWDDHALTPVGFPGQQVNPADRVIKPMPGGFSVVVDSPEAWQRFARALRDQRTQYSPLYRRQVLQLDYHGERYILPVRLAKEPAAPGHQPRSGSVMKIELIADGGLWLQPVSVKGGQARVTNMGPVPVWPRFRWQAAGQVTLPSGATIELPAVDTPHVLRVAWVYDADGLDGALTRRVTAVSESVQPGETAVFTASAGVWIEWDIGVMNPWA